jgi:hypothetical protein
MISDSYAVIDPWTVMIKSVNALVADSAVSTSGTFDYFAFRAKTAGVELFH